MEALAPGRDQRRKDQSSGQQERGGADLAAMARGRKVTGTPVAIVEAESNTAGLSTGECRRAESFCPASVEVRENAGTLETKGVVLRRLVDIPAHLRPAAGPRLVVDETFGC